MEPHDWSNLPLPKPKPSIEPRFLGWLLFGGLSFVGISLLASELLFNRSDRLWSTLSSGVSYIALAVIICPKSQAPFWIKSLASVVGVFIL